MYKGHAHRGAGWGVQLRGVPRERGVKMKKKVEKKKMMKEEKETVRG